MAENTTKTKSKGFIRRGAKSLVDVKSWIAWDSVTQNARTVKNFASDAFQRVKPEHHETFEQAVERLKLTEKDIQQKQKMFLLFSAIYLLMAIGLVGYAVIVFFAGYFVTGLLCLSLTALVLAYAYREHFWYTQVKNRKFGCTFKDWVALNFKRAKK